MAGVAAIVREADVCLALGTHFNEYTTLTWKTPLPGALIRVDRDRGRTDDELSRNRDDSRRCCRNARLALGARPRTRPASSPARPRDRALQERRRGESCLPSWRPTPIPHRRSIPAIVTRLLREAFPPERSRHPMAPRRNHGSTSPASLSHAPARSLCRRCSRRWAMPSARRSVLRSARRIACPGGCRRWQPDDDARRTRHHRGDADAPDDRRLQRRAIQRATRAARGAL